MTDHQAGNSRGAGQCFIIASLGSIGRRHLGNLRTLRPEATIVGLRRSETMQADDGDIRVVTSVEQALKLKPTAAFIAGPAPTHVPLAIAFMHSGIPTFIEKPLSHKLDGLSALRTLAAQQGVPVMVGYNLRFDPLLIELRKSVRDGIIGEVLTVRAEAGQHLSSWRPGTDYRASVSARGELGGGALLELSHEIDYIYWLFGLPDFVSCRGGHLSALEIDVEDCVELCLEYRQPRRIVSIHLDFLQHATSRTCKLVGSDGSIFWDAIAGRLGIYRQNAPERLLNSASQDRNQMYVDEMTQFLNAIGADGPIDIPLDDGIAVMRIVATARRAMVTGCAEALLSLDGAA